MSWSWAPAFSVWDSVFCLFPFNFVALFSLVLTFALVKFVFWFCVHHFLCYSQVFPALLCSPHLVSVSIIFSVVRQFCLCLHRSVNFMCFSLSRVIFVIVSSVQFASLVLVNWFGSPEPCCPQLCRFPWLSHVYLSPQFLSVLYHVVAPPSSIVPSLFCYEISSSFLFRSRFLLFSILFPGLQQ